MVAIDAIRFLITVLWILILIRVLVSWFPSVDPFHPVVRFLTAVVDPVLKPFRRLLPTLASVDFSPILAFCALFLLSDALGSFVSQLPFPLAYRIGLVVDALLSDLALFFIIITVLRVLIGVLRVEPLHPFSIIVRTMSDPLIRPFRGMVATRTSTADVAALLALGAYILLYVVINQLFAKVILPGLLR